MVTELAGHVRQEPGNMTFAVYTKAEDPRPLDLRGLPRRGGLPAHLAAPYGGPFNAELSDLIEEDGSVLTFLTPVV